MTHSFSDMPREKHAGCFGYVTQSCTSTMDLAWNLSGRDLFPEFAWVRAETQIRGRGQFGREWVSGKGNLFVTIRLPDSAQILGSLLSLAMALCVVKTLETLNIPARIKWPNDIMIGAVKVGGILIEKKAERIMAGIGLNICTAPKSCKEETFFHIQAGCLKEFGVNLKSFKLWIRVLEKIIHQIPGMLSDPCKVAENAQAFIAWKGETVVLEDTGDWDGPARILGIDLQGRLCIQTAKGISSIRSGRISPRVV